MRVILRTAGLLSIPAKVGDVERTLQEPPGLRVIMEIPVFLSPPEPPFGEVATRAATGFQSEATPIGIHPKIDSASGFRYRLVVRVWSRTAIRSSKDGSCNLEHPVWWGATSPADSSSRVALLRICGKISGQTRFSRGVPGLCGDLYRSALASSGFVGRIIGNQKRVVYETICCPRFCRFGNPLRNVRPPGGQ